MVYTKIDAEYFAEHPIRPFDPHGSRNIYGFINEYNDFVSYIKSELARIIEKADSDLAARKSLAAVKSLYHKARTKIDNYAYHSGNALLPPYRYARSSGYPRGCHPFDL